MLLHIVKKYKELGFKDFIKLVIYNIHYYLIIYCNRLYEIYHGVDIFSITPLSEVTRNTDLSGCEDYEAAPIGAVSRCLSLLDLNTADYTFIDLGCGKGLALLQAMAFPFEHVIGVDISEDLADIAKRNLQKGRFFCMRAGAARAIVSDVRKAELPDHALIIFMFNPFFGEVLDKTLELIENHRNKTAKKIFILYYNPKHQESFDIRPAFRTIFSRESIPTFFSMRNYGLIVYEALDRSRVVKNHI